MLYKESIFILTSDTGLIPDWNVDWLVWKNHSKNTIPESQSKLKTRTQCKRAEHSIVSRESLGSNEHVPAERQSW